MLERKNKKNPPDNSLVDKVNQDLIVHNMPNRAKLSGAIYSSKPAFISRSTSASGFSEQKSEVKNNSKKVGVIIIGLGIIFVLVLIYFSYRFIVKPGTNAEPSTTAELNTTSPENQATGSESELALSTSTVDVQISDPAVLNINENGDNLASSTLELENILLPPIVDSDSDGLNDFEEEALGTNINLSDSDSDTYDDFSELNKIYNPAGEGKLIMNQNVAEYRGKYYQLIYPANWGTSSLNNDETVIITAPDNSLIQISLQDNTDVQSILTWYEETFPDVVVTYDKLKKGSGWEGIMSPDNLNFYLSDDKRDKIYVISYIAAVGDRAAYPNIFNLIINSFSVK